MKFREIVTRYLFPDNDRVTVVVAVQDGDAYLLREDELDGKIVMAGLTWSEMEQIIVRAAQGHARLEYDDDEGCLRVLDVTKKNLLSSVRLLAKAQVRAATVAREEVAAAAMRDHERSKARAQMYQKRMVSAALRMLGESHNVPEIVDRPVEVRLRVYSGGRVDVSID